MIKQCLLVLLATSFIAVGASSAAAQDSQPAQGNSQWRSATLNPAQRTHELAEKLDLTPDQQTKVMDIYQSERSQMETLRQDPSLTDKDQRVKMKDVHKNTDTQIRAVLDANQKKKWDQMQAKPFVHRGDPPS